VSSGSFLFDSRAPADSPHLADFGYVDLDNLVFPSVMRIDYIRIYQDSDHINSEFGVL
jgi:hypothetical protein